jgi:pyruvate dehydrogenase E2 component (dihydrolipoamide acetyltransferase)
MAIEIKMPKLGQTTDEVHLVRWLVSEGDTVAKGQPLCEAENDKTTMDVESYAAGTVLRLSVEPDTVIPAGTVIAVLGEPGEKPDSGKPKPPAPAETEPTSAAPPQASPGSPPTSPGSLPSAARSAAAGAPGARSAAAGPPGALPRDALPPGVRATRLVQNIARKRGVELTRVRGTGARGLITKRDVEAYLQGGAAAAAGDARSAEATAAGTVGGREIPTAVGGTAGAAGGSALSNRQLALGRNLQASKSRIPHYYLKATVFCERLLSWRDTNLLPDGGRVSIDALLASACARALARHPTLNAAFRDDGLHPNPRVHVGVAVSAGAELYVPVIRDADRRDVREIDRELRFLAAKARSGRLAPEEERGGTFTLTNLGMYPVEEFGAIINPPQVAILAFARIAGRLEVDDSGAMRVRQACTATGSFDHRAVNGAQGAAFLAELKKIVEEEL